jgi:hypothetical protein
MNVGDYVSNPKASHYGIGKVVSNDGRYLAVYFESLDEEKDYAVDDHPLKKENSSIHGKTENIHGARTQKKGIPSTSNKLTERIKRDKINVSLAPVAAKSELHKKGIRTESIDITGGNADAAAKRQQGLNDEVKSLNVIMEHPFHAMMEVLIVSSDRRKEIKKEQLVYANEYISCNWAHLGDKKINILAWTHPIVQLALSGYLREENDIRARGYTLKSVTPLARAKFSQVKPEISGLYEPGGPIRPEISKKQRTGLKAVKLDMTRDQVKAFLSRMNGMMLVSGAPGSGKTTVAMQRIRFLYDQQEVRQEELRNVSYTPEQTKIFLANQNLIDYSKRMLEKELSISSSVVELVSDFISRYLAGIWAHKQRAKVRRKKLSFYDTRGRQAFFGLCNVAQLKNCWNSFEKQISERLSSVNDVPWLKDVAWFSFKNRKLSKKGHELSKALQAYSKKKIAYSPSSSLFRMDSLYHYVDKSYEGLRELHRQNGDLEEFDLQFQKWLYWVYDPLDGIKSYFLEEAYAGKIRIKNGIAGKIAEDEILNNIKKDWEKRTYGLEEEPWLAFLLRFSLPIETDHKARFRETANPLDIAIQNSGERWTHIMIDEAQDLCVAEAALLGSFVHPDGAFTVSADFHQVVSPVWGMENSEAFNIGSPLKGEEQLFPFAKNMRQSKQIGLFLKEFYHSAFGEIAPFEANDTIDIQNSAPLLMLCSSSEFSIKIKQRLAVMRRNPDINTIALLQINEDDKAMEQLRSALQRQGVEMAPIWESADTNNKLITTSVERIKGLEYDACFVVGMDDIDNSTLNYSKNRAYVALSRPALQLTILCEEFPQDLQRINKDCIKIVNI